MAKDIDLKMQSLLKISKTFWDKLAVIIKGLIIDDAINGTVQQFTSQIRPTKAGAKQYSVGYKKAKMNFMRRSTAGIGKGYGVKYNRKTGELIAVPLFFRNPKVKEGKIGKYLSGQSRAIDNSSTPNMRLTGDTLLGLDYKSSTDTSLTMSYKPKDEKKIRWNAEMGRLITTLNDKNQEKVRKQIEDELVKNISDWYKDKIIITVG